MIVKVYEIKSGDIIGFNPQMLSSRSIESFIEMAKLGVKIIHFTSNGYIYRKGIIWKIK